SITTICSAADSPRETGEGIPSVESGNGGGLARMIDRNERAELSTSPLAVPGQATRNPLRICILMGTRPEVSKMAPCVRAMQGVSSFDTVVVSTGQHREMLHPLLETLELRPHHDLAAMTPNQKLSDLNGTIVKRIGALLADIRPELVLVHGDT